MIPDRYCPALIKRSTGVKACKKKQVIEVVPEALSVSRSSYNTRSKSTGVVNVTRSEAEPPRSQPLKLTVSKVSASISRDDQKSTYTAPQMQRMKTRFLEQFGLAKRTKGSHEAAYRSWQIWEQQGSEAIIDEEHLSDYMFNEIAKGRKISGVSTYLGGIGASLIKANKLDEKQWSVLIESRSIRQLKQAASKREVILGKSIK